ncbi:hypothetical protein QSJ18_13585 [Gordonia sp. ABSL1-1]|uniref:hypothetical protein n=1 Tax=Gordonia sp. ABSL1-1 TaxID=3053923 RepID=UPI00257361A8|nr:hypothetical protein [Gordonia sp. ABSL1-1]MDL9937780.1 hypothetical protein [Gordonia sp. ABSL1-1]
MSHALPAGHPAVRRSRVRVAIGVIGVLAVAAPVSAFAGAMSPAHRDVHPSDRPSPAVVGVANPTGRSPIVAVDPTLFRLERVTATVFVG